MYQFKLQLLIDQFEKENYLFEFIEKKLFDMG